MNGMSSFGRGPIETVLTAEQTKALGLEGPVELYMATPVERRDQLRAMRAWNAEDAENPPETVAAPVDEAALTPEQLLQRQMQASYEYLAANADRVGFNLWLVLRRGWPGMTVEARYNEQWNTTPQMMTANVEDLARAALPGAEEWSGGVPLLIAGQWISRLMQTCKLTSVEADSPKDPSLAPAETPISPLP